MLENLNNGGPGKDILQKLYAIAIKTIRYTKFVLKDFLNSVVRFGYLTEKMW